MIPIRCLGLALCASAAAISSIGAMQKPPAKIVTTSSGVYTSKQASRGEQTYMSTCVTCHPPGTYTAPAFRQKWDGAPLSELYGYISNMMPKQEPGSLTSDDYADVVAYLLKINGAPAGKQELPADEKAMKKIRINMPRSK